MFKIKFYSTLATLFWLIRQYAIPNPFEALGEGITVTIGGAPILLSPEILNWIADPIIGAFTFLVVGIYYISGSNPTKGSILYMLFYTIHIGMLFLISSVYPTIWLIVLIAVIYLAFHVALLILKFKYF